MPIITKSVVFNNNAPVGCPPGGTEDQLLAKNSNLNFDYKWIDAPEPVVLPPARLLYVGHVNTTGGPSPTITLIEETLNTTERTFTWGSFGVGVATLNCNEPDFLNRAINITWYRTDAFDGTKTYNIGRQFDLLMFSTHASESTYKCMIEFYDN